MERSSNHDAVHAVRACDVPEGSDDPPPQLLSPLGREYGLVVLEVVNQDKIGAMLTVDEPAYRTTCASGKETDTMPGNEAAFRPLRAPQIPEVLADALVLRELVTHAAYERARLVGRVGDDDDEAAPAVAGDVGEQGRKAR